MEGCFHYVALCQEISVYGYPMAVSCRSELSNDRKSAALRPSSQNKRSCSKYQAGRLVYRTHRLFVCLFGYGACKCLGMGTNAVSSVWATIITV